MVLVKRGEGLVVLVKGGENVNGGSKKRRGVSGVH